MLSYPLRWQENTKTHQPVSSGNIYSPPQMFGTIKKLGKNAAGIHHPERCKKRFKRRLGAWILINVLPLIP